MAAPVKLETPAQNGAFVALVFSIFGWALIETWVFAQHGAIFGHALVAMVGVPLVAIATRRYRLHWPPTRSEHQLSNGRKISDAGGCVLLLVTGYLLGQLVLAGWMFQMSIFTVALTFVPWSRISFCRRQFLASLILVAGAAAYPVFAAASPVVPISYLTAGWVLFMTACLALLRQR